MSRITLVMSVGLLAACSNESRRFHETDLVSDLPDRALRIDPALVNPWGIAVDRDHRLWIANTGSGVITVLDTDGNPSDVAPVATGLPVTGVDINATGAFPLAEGAASAPAQAVFATRTGRIIGFSDRLRTLTAVGFALPDARFTGVAIAHQDSGPLMFVADFPNKRVLMLDANFTVIGSIGDPTLSPSFGPLNIRRIGDRIYVVYAIVGPTGEVVRGAGFGRISRFNLDGTFERRITSGGLLNAPCGIERAPERFGAYGNRLLVSNFGDGHLIAIDEPTLETELVLSDVDGQPIEIPGLWGLAAVDDSVFFVAGGEDETHGLFGRIEQQEPVSASSRGAPGS